MSCQRSGFTGRCTPLGILPLFARVRDQPELLSRWQGSFLEEHVLLCTKRLSAPKFVRIIIVFATVLMRTSARGNRALASSRSAYPSRACWCRVMWERSAPPSGREVHLNKLIDIRARQELPTWCTRSEEH